MNDERRCSGGRKQNKTPVTNLFKHPGYRYERTILIKTYNLLVHMVFPVLYTKLGSREITRFSPELTLARQQSSFPILRSPFVTPTSYARLPCHERTCLRDRKLHISVYKVLRIDIFLKLTHRFASEVLY